MGKFVLIAIVASGVAALVAPTLAQAQGQAQNRVPTGMGPLPIRPDTEAGKVFACEGQRELIARFDTRNARLVAIVDIGEGPIELPVLPWEGGEPKVTWSDGPRTLVWTTGVKLMYTDATHHLMCGRSLDEPHH